MSAVTAATIFAGIGAAASVAGALGVFGGKESPQVVQQTPLADNTAAETTAAQLASEKKLQQRRAARANSLLSAAGAAGDTTDPLKASGAAIGKLALGA